MYQLPQQKNNNKNKRRLQTFVCSMKLKPTFLIFPAVFNSILIASVGNICHSTMYYIIIILYIYKIYIYIYIIIIYI